MCLTLTYESAAKTENRLQMCSRVLRANGYDVWCVRMEAFWMVAGGLQFEDYMFVFISELDLNVNHRNSTKTTFRAFAYIIYLYSHKKDLNNLNSNTSTK